MAILACILFQSNAPAATWRSRSEKPKSLNVSDQVSFAKRSQIIDTEENIFSENDEKVVPPKATVPAEPKKRDRQQPRTITQPAEIEAAAPAVPPCRDSADQCQDALTALRLDGIEEINLDIRVGGISGDDYPCECRLEGEVFKPRLWSQTTVSWYAAGYCHKPLYFEDSNLERYGQSRGWLADPFVSAAHFFVSLPVLPYKMGVELPWECVYPVGYYRPGSCAPWTVPAVPISLRGMAIEAATITGIVFVLP